MGADNTTDPQQFSLFDVEPPAAVEAVEEAASPAGRFSNFVVYVDESGAVSYTHLTLPTKA